jgi:hypothetical protein
MLLSFLPFCLFLSFCFCLCAYLLLSFFHSLFVRLFVSFLLYFLASLFDSVFPYLFVWFLFNSSSQPLYFVCFSVCFGSRDSSVGIGTGYGLDGREGSVGVRVPVGSRIFSSSQRPDRFWGPPNLLSNGYRGALSPGVKRQGREADHSPSTSAEIKKTWIYTSTPPYAFTA